MRHLLRFLVRVLLPVLALVAVVNRLPERQSGAPLEQARDAFLAGDTLRAKAIYQRLIESDPYDLALHRGYLDAHLRTPKRSGRGAERDDRAIVAGYNGYIASGNPRLADVGHYALGYFHNVERDWELALEQFRQVADDRLPFLHNSRGRALEEVGRLDEAELEYRREIELGTQAPGAYANLSRLLFETHRIDRLRALAADPPAARNFPARVRRYLELDRGAYLGYAREALLFSGVTLPGFVAALLVLAAWFFYLRQIDVFEPERYSNALLTLGGGMVFSLLTTPLYDLLDFGLGFRLGGSAGHDLLFCVLGIGLVEETVKIVPVLLVMRFTRAIDESIDYVVYGSLSALGFAFVENLLYFGEGGLVRIAGRGLTAVLLHMTLTSLVMYGLFYARYRARRRPLAWFALTFAAAVVTHGVYDFWLVARGTLGEFRILSTGVLVATVVFYGKAIAHALNLSEFDDGRAQRLLDVTLYLSYALGGIIALEYVMVALLHGPRSANHDALVTLFGSLFLVSVILGALGRFTVTRGR